MDRKDKEELADLIADRVTGHIVVVAALFGGVWLIISILTAVISWMSGS